MSDSVVFILFEFTLHGQKQVRAVTQTSWSGELWFYALHFDIMRSTNKVIVDSCCNFRVMSWTKFKVLDLYLLFFYYY